MLASGKKRGETLDKVGKILSQSASSVLVENNIFSFRIVPD